ncbi:heat-inducible transcriptional repressor HrcA [Cellulomonas fimi]|uniref:Heat-inducible transcription repressor HrcA n=1 Tax=Cellulomonas fimi (strain ATCC 484 / DSM 20113 / JCM 1341 / CCUG 24087 / LMG 16345 / NBRC 15513 / NCIMB 8980 / NCTC 7547 / NRS-133) TaxID=590998 RepID=F4H2X9_CELFA|nr:heat-inducible transcriptional repressor HrcA [Cellulomonas fimi]AEE46478.1 heat-inducible transcription repressor HrcA [Cellulomonas fimi ATCC 484]NNH08232.1 heat-inducible transcriptional repressor HrcA [Cellulomonas fimi]VEH33159.1 Heat-inducible transcription repressor HrcA [Cellulomonas fimi]
MSEDRRLDVLRAIVEDYVATKEPVGSRALVERHALGVSPATIRNDMAALEEGGYIAQPHTSAGRVPTDKGYRLFVDRLTTVKPMSGAERRAIGAFLDHAVDLDDVVDRAVRLIAQLTGQVAVVQYPSLRRSALRHVELVAVGARHLLVVLITDTGRVEQRTLEQDRDLDEVVLAQLRARLNAAATGRRLSQLPEALGELPDAFAPEDAGLVRAVAAVVEETLAQESEERVVLAGTANLARGGGADFAHTIGPVLEALEEQVVLLRLLSEMAEDQAAVSLRIGRETQHEGLLETSFVTTGYGDDGGTSLARVGSIGPLRMDYPGTMTAVRAVARYLTRILAG